MADNMGKIWSVNDLMKRYNINRASLIEYAKAKENVINASAVNMQKTGKEWQFNSEAVRILDELRGYGIVIENYDSPEKARIAELEKELEEARTFMAAAQAENSRQKDKIIELLEEKAEAVKLLACAEADRKMAENDVAIIKKTRELENETASSEIERQKMELSALKEERAVVKAEADMLRKELQEAQAALKAEKSKTLLQRIFRF